MQCHNLSSDTCTLCLFMRYIVQVTKLPLACTAYCLVEHVQLVQFDRSLLLCTMMNMFVPCDVYNHPSSRIVAFRLWSVFLCMPSIHIYVCICVEHVHMHVYHMCVYIYLL